MINALKLSKALSDKNRVKILQVLSEGDLRVGDVANYLDVEENLASHHLRVLTTLGFLKGTKRGREVFYKINRTKLVSILKDLCKSPSFREVFEEALKEIKSQK